MHQPISASSFGASRGQQPQKATAQVKGHQRTNCLSRRWYSILVVVLWWLCHLHQDFNIKINHHPMPQVPCKDAKSQSHVTQHCAFAPAKRSHCYMAICTMLSYELKRMCRATLGNTKRTLRQDQREKCPSETETATRRSVLVALRRRILCILVSSYSLKKHTICANFARDFLQKWNLQDCQIITGSATADFALRMSPNIVPTKHNYSSMAQNTAPATPCHSAMWFPFIPFLLFLPCAFPRSFPMMTLLLFLSVTLSSSFFLLLFFVILMILKKSVTRTLSNWASFCKSSRKPKSTGQKKRTHNTWLYFHSIWRDLTCSHLVSFSMYLWSDVYIFWNLWLVILMISIPKFFSVFLGFSHCFTLFPIGCITLFEFIICVFKKASNQILSALHLKIDSLKKPRDQENHRENQKTHGQKKANKSCSIQKAGSFTKTPEN